MNIINLPALNQPLESGIFAGIITRPSGVHCAVVLLPDRGEGLTWNEAGAWATKLGAELPTRPVAAMIFANVTDRPQIGWHWTSEVLDASSAWGCYFLSGYQLFVLKSYEGSAVAVRYIELGAA